MLAKAPKLAPEQIKSFRAQIWAFYRHSSRKLPWRNTKKPYRILVSEIMLQQTQVSRVLEKYPVFLKKFPTIKKLSSVSLAEVLRIWQGMGYNRRARYLHEAAQTITQKHHGHIPKTEKELRALPGVGHYTANAILAFTNNEPTIFIETNIRRVFIHHFFSKRKNVSDAKILLLVKQTIDKTNPREWYYALMDYGSHLPKVTKINSNTQSKHYVKQSKFKGSLRELRGKIIQSLSKENQTFRMLKQVCNNDARTNIAIETLLKDKLIIRFTKEHQTRYSLA